MIQDMSKQFFDFMFPDAAKLLVQPEVDYDTNSMKVRQALIYGQPDSGKTETVRYIVEYAVAKYGKEHVNAVYSEEGWLNHLIDYLDDSLVTILFADNITAKILGTDVMRRYAMIRDVWKAKIHRNYGLVVGFIGTHRFHSTKDVELRTNLSTILWKNAPMNQYDQNIAKFYLGAEGLEQLKELDEQREEDPRLKGVSVFNKKTEVGLLLTPMAKVDYLRKVNPKADHVSDLKKILEKLEGLNGKRS